MLNLFKMKHIMKHLRHFFALLMLLCTNMVFSQTFEKDGINYNILDTEAKTVAVTSKTDGYSGDVVIPATVEYGETLYSVVEIGSVAFYSDVNLTSVVIPEGVKKIEVGLFDFCEKLTAVQLPSTITSIESNAFSDCHSLKSIVIPNKVKSIGAFAFARCEALKTINIPDGLEIIDDQAFRESGLTTVTIPVSVTQIHPRSFEDCKYLGENHANVILLDKSHKGQINGYEWVDLGLPSGTLWAKCNLGAENETDAGDYFAWGETETKKDYKLYRWSKYK